MAINSTVLAKLTSTWEYHLVTGGPGVDPEDLGARLMSNRRGSMFDTEIDLDAADPDEIDALAEGLHRVAALLRLDRDPD